MLLPRIPIDLPRSRTRGRIPYRRLAAPKTDRLVAAGKGHLRCHSCAVELGEFRVARCIQPVNIIAGLAKARGELVGCDRLCSAAFRWNSWNTRRFGLP